MNAIENYVRQYVFVGSGETIRGAIVAALSEVIQVAAHTDIGTLTDWKSWAISLGVAALNGAVHYVFGKLPAATS